MLRLLNILILLVNVEVLFHGSGATSTTVDVFVTHPDGGVTTMKLLVPTIMSKNKDDLLQRLFMHPKIVNKGCIDKLVDEGSILTRLYLKDCALFFRKLSKTDNWFPRIVSSIYE